MYQDYKDLLSAFQSHGIKYLVVGGFAVIYHSQPRFTNDIDLFIKAEPENARATYAALADFGVSLQGIRPEDFTDRNSFFRFGSEPKGIDILPAIPGVDFDAAWERRVETVIDPATGLKANFISAGPHRFEAGFRTTARPCGRGRHPQGAGEPAARRSKKPRAERRWPVTVTSRPWRFAGGG